MKSFADIYTTENGAHHLKSPGKKLPWIEFNASIKKWIDVYTIYHKGPGIDDNALSWTDTLEKSFKEMMCKIDPEYDHCHNANTSIKYLFRDTVTGGIYPIIAVTDSSDKWKMWRGSDLEEANIVKAYFYIYMYKDALVRTNTITKMTDIPILIHNLISATWNHIQDNVEFWTSGIWKETHEMEKEIANFEFGVSS